MNKRPLILVAYRDRETHLKCFLSYMAKVFRRMDICVIEQFDNKPWNKGLLFNAGFKEYSKDYDYIIFHDVDFLPDKTVDYSYCSIPTLLATECSQFNYQHCYDRFFGGVTAMDKEHYLMVNGFSNLFKGWGGEDDLMYNSFLQKGIQPQKRLGNRFENFIHPHMDVRPGGKDFMNPDYQHNLKLCTSPRDFSEGLSTAQYKIVSQHKEPHYTHLKITT